MDGLVLIACTVLFILLVVIPVMSILAYRRSNAAREELSRLRQRVDLLEQQLSGQW
jgi:heme/copper-type cytochrome/quinol oxidase subunit 2